MAVSIGTAVLQSVGWLFTSHHSIVYRICAPWRSIGRRLAVVAERLSCFGWQVSQGSAR